MCIQMIMVVGLLGWQNMSLKIPILKARLSSVLFSWIWQEIAGFPSKQQHLLKKLKWIR